MKTFSNIQGREVESVFVCVECPDCKKEVPARLKSLGLIGLRNWMLFDLHLALFYKNLLSIAIGFVVFLFCWLLGGLGFLDLSLVAPMVLYGSIGALMFLACNLYHHYKEVKPTIVDLDIQVEEDKKDA